MKGAGQCRRGLPVSESGSTRPFRWTTRGRSGTGRRGSPRPRSPSSRRTGTRTLAVSGTIRAGSTTRFAGRGANAATPGTCTFRSRRPSD
nr:MAG TPA: hypothetical protein [Caudoviricetes sp.]